MKTSQPLMDLPARASLMPSPKNVSISTSRKPHVRIEIVTYEPNPVGTDGKPSVYYYGRRIDLSVAAFLRIVKTMQFGPDRTELTETLKAAGLWK